jgi:hypothetical protein
VRVQSAATNCLDMMMGQVINILVGMLEQIRAIQVIVVQFERIACR